MHRDVEKWLMKPPEAHKNSGGPRKWYPQLWAEKSLCVCVCVSQKLPSLDDSFDSFDFLFS